MIKDIPVSTPFFNEKPSSAQKLSSKISSANEIEKEYRKEVATSEKVEPVVEAAIPDGGSKDAKIEK